MAIINSIISYRRSLKRKNCAKGTVKNYMNALKNFVTHIDVPIEKVTNHHIQIYIDFLLDKRLEPKTINNILDSIRSFYNYLHNEEKVIGDNPVKKGYSLRLGHPLPKHLRSEEVEKLFGYIRNLRDHAMFMVMLRCGLRVEEVANLTWNAIDFKRGHILVFRGKGTKGRVVYFSQDTYEVLTKYLKQKKTGQDATCFSC